MEKIPYRDLEQRLMNLHDSAGKIIAKTTYEESGKLGTLLQLEIDIKKWETLLSDRPELNLLKKARQDLAFAIYAASTGCYSHAYSGTRTFLELSIASIHFSANELHRRRWVNGREDFSWAKALDSNEGVTSSKFVQEFNIDVVNEIPAYGERAAECYRVCSEFIHGKFAFTQTIPEQLEYSPNLLFEWNRVTRAAAECVLFLLYCRYGSEVLAEHIEVLGETLESTLGHLKSVRKSLGLPMEQR